MTNTTRRELLRRGAIVTGAAGLGLAAMPGTSLAGCNGDHECARTPGFWKNHYEMWAGHGVNGLDLGDDTYSNSELLDILNTPSRGDKSITMAKHLIAALLNQAAGVEDSCIEDYIEDARDWLEGHPVGSDQRTWDGGERIKNKLDEYNNGDSRCAC